MKPISSLQLPLVRRDVALRIWNDGKNAFRMNRCLTTPNTKIVDQEEDEIQDGAHHEATGHISLLNLKLSLL